MEPISHADPGHFSTVDWDKSSPNWQLTGVFGFISAPYALAGTTPSSLFLSKHPQAQNLPDGQIITWFRHLREIPCKLYFRNQSPGIGQPTDPHYEVRMERDVPYSLWCKHEAGEYQVGAWPYATSSTAWWRIRITWWRGSTLQGEWALVTQMELWVAGGWANYGMLYDTADRWANSDTNRVGLLLQVSGNVYDDTEIWKPT